MPFLSHNQQCHRAEGKTLLNIPSKYTISTILSSNKNHNRDVLVPAKPGPPGKLAVKMDRDMQTEIHLSPESSWTHDWKKDVLFGFGNCMSHGHRRQ